MGKKVILYGNGASAKGFLLAELTDYDVQLVASEDSSGGQFEGYDCISTLDVIKRDFDFVIVASWAIHEITERLVKTGIPKEKILWFQHHKNRVLEWGHKDFYQSHQHIPAERILYSVYDMNVARATYDIIGFLCLAECERVARSLDAIHVVIVNASNNEFNASRWGIQNKDEHEWRVHQMLMQCCSLLPSCVGISKTATRSEVTSLLQGKRQCFPSQYSEQSPEVEYEFNCLFDKVNDGQAVAHLRANSEALNFVQQYLKRHNPENKKVVTISLRDTISKPARNSKPEEWLKFLQWLDKSEFFPVIIPDTEHAFGGMTEAFSAYQILEVAAFNVEFRMALYELSYINLGVNNGPIHLCALNKECRYIMYKQIVENYPHSSTQSFLDRGFDIGGMFPGATRWQKFVWEDDDYDVIRQHFVALVNDIEAEQNAKLLEWKDS